VLLRLPDLSHPALADRGHEQEVAHDLARGEAGRRLRSLLRALPPEERQRALLDPFLNSDGTVAFETKISETSGGFGGVLDPGDRFGASVSSLGDLSTSETQFHLVAHARSERAFVGEPRFDGGARLRNGSGANEVSFLNACSPRAGEEWLAWVDASAHKEASASFVWVTERPLAGWRSPFGELLVDVVSKQPLFVSRIHSQGGTDVHAMRIPREALGLTFSLQAVVLDEQGLSPHECHRPDDPAIALDPAASGAVRRNRDPDSSGFSGAGQRARAPRDGGEQTGAGCVPAAPPVASAAPPRTSAASRSHVGTRPQVSELRRRRQRQPLRARRDLRLLQRDRSSGRGRRVGGALEDSRSKRTTA